MKINKKRVLWRNDSDYFNNLYSGKKQGNKDTPASDEETKKAVRKLTAAEAAQTLAYGERDGKNVIGDEYKKNTYMAKLFRT